ncbi:MAG: cytochrome P450 [Acidimicrobiales bacterium]|jgi:cytochrome P450 family 142 subfamily A polypeptide 1|nr:cytochrome P450 [Acidimicrobiales bacterium]
MIDPRPLDILAGDFYVNDPYSRYAWLRENSPVHWDDVNELWVITRYDDIIEIEKNKRVFINSDKEKGYRPNMGADESIIANDDPLHQARRVLVSRRFTPRAVRQWDDEVLDTVDSLLDAALAKGRAEIVGELAAPLPAMMIGLLLGFPEDMWPKLQHWSETTIALGGGPRYHDESGIIAAMEFGGAAAELYEEKKKCPADDVMSHWVDIEAETGGEVGGAPFGLDQIISDCLLLLDGGAETTRTVIARTLLALADHPGEWAKLQNGADMEIATEEFIRWVTPIHNFCRMATEDYELHGQTIRQGDQVVLAYAGANRDPAHFDEPELFDVTRDPNHHISFGFGTHFCLGASLARLEIQTFFERLVARVESLERLPDEPHVEMPNAFVFGLKEAHMAFTPRSEEVQE